MAAFAQPTGPELADAEQYLRTLDLPEDRPFLDNGQQYYSVLQLVGKLFGMGESAIRDKAESGEIPHATLAHGWKIPRSGVLYYIATQRREQTQRRANAG